MRGEFQKDTGPVSPRGTERFCVSIFFFVTPHMWSAIKGVAKIHGVAPAYMVRTILMGYLDFHHREGTSLPWRDDRTQNRTRKVHVTLTTSTRKLLDELADYHGMSNNQIIRLALQHYFSRHPLTRPRREPRRDEHKNGAETRTDPQRASGPVAV